MNSMEMAYRKMAVGGASGLGLLIALYDTLAGDLRRAADAERANDIEKRCREANHALLVIAHLEDVLSRGVKGELTQQLAAFYSSLRRKLIEAQAKRSVEILEQQMSQVLKIRAVWQGIASRGESSTTEVPSWVPAQNYPGGSSTMYEQGASRWSA
ncbi:MAG: flagellar export chaperone FliS [Terracidiphilus sp.]|jgi:flagellar secretion chaperone FliS